MGNLNGILSSEDKRYRDKLQDNGRIYMAEVMDTRSPLKIGDLKVWIINTNSNKKDPSNWITAKCVSPVYGCTSNKEDISDDENISFGWWNPMPYVGNYVFVFFPNLIGGNSECYWFGSPMDVSNVMLPGISYDLTKENNTDYKPTCDKNYYKTTNKDKPKEYKVLSKALKEQGLDEDRFRGISTASSFRETPSRCYGFLSPLGNQFVIDDGWVAEGEKQSWIENPKKKQEGKYDDKAMHTEKDDYGFEHNKKQWKADINESGKDDKLNRFHGGFRFRTRNGTQLLILDCGTIYMINKDGSAWVELSNDGYIDCYSKAGISATSDGDINFYAKKDINLECENQIRMSSKKGILMDTPGNINANGGSFNSSSHISVETIEANTGVINSFKSSNAEINGIFSGSLQGTAYYATYAGREPVEQEKPNIKEQIQIPETTKIKKHKTNTKQKKNPVNKETVVSRRPLHEPWEEHNKNDFIPKLNSIGKPNNKSKNEKNNSINNSQNKSELTVNNNLVGQNNGNKS